VYVSGCTATMMNVPASFATALLGSEVLALVSVILAPGTTWPAGSTTTPDTLPVIVIWAGSGPQQSPANRTKHKNWRIFDFGMALTSPVALAQSYKRPAPESMVVGPDGPDRWRR